MTYARLLPVFNRMCLCVYIASRTLGPCHTTGVEKNRFKTMTTSTKWTRQDKNCWKPTYRLFFCLAQPLFHFRPKHKSWVYLDGLRWFLQNRPKVSQRNNFLGSYSRNVLVILLKYCQTCKLVYSLHTNILNNTRMIFYLKKVCTRTDCSNKHSAWINLCTSAENRWE